VNTGNRFGGDPGIGAWVNYGLGTLNQNLPGFVVLPRTSYPQGGASNWSNGFLPAAYQGTPLRPKGSPILDLNPPPGVSRERQRTNLDLLASLNKEHLASRPGRSELDARMASYELAYRMQTEVPGILDLDGEKAATLERYGIGDSKTDAFGRKCLLARRLVEKGVRFVQAYAGNWDSHDYIERAHGSLIRSVDKPIAALLGDLKERGLLQDTLVVWCGEFGRTPDNGNRAGGKSYPCGSPAAAPKAATPSAPPTNSGLKRSTAFITSAMFTSPCFICSASMTTGLRITMPVATSSCPSSAGR